MSVESRTSKPMRRSFLRGFVLLTVVSLCRLPHQAWLSTRVSMVTRRAGPVQEKYNYEAAAIKDTSKVLTRDVKVTDVRDLNELLKLKDPLAPTEQMLLTAITLDDGTRMERPTVEDLRKLRPTTLRPIMFHWSDASREQTRAPKEYDEIIQRLLNAGPAEMEDLVRANWKTFDKGFYFRLTEIKTETKDERLREKLVNLENLSYDVLKVAQEQMRKQVPEAAKDAQEVLSSMFEPDRTTLLWPPSAEAYVRLAETITKLATRAKYEDGWFESVLEIAERFAERMEREQQTQLGLMAQIAMQRTITEWLRRDTLWEETDEGQFIFRLMSISHEQWATQLMYENKPLDVNKLRDEIKIISETKVIALPMGSKLQIYAAKYLQGMMDFFQNKDSILEDMKKEATSR